MDFNYFNISLFVGGLVAIIAGFLPYVFEKTKTNRAWLFLNLAVAVWSFGYFSMISTDVKNIAWISQIFMHFAATLIPVFYLHFILELTERKEKYKNNLRAVYILAFLLLTLVPFKFYISDVIPKYIFKYVVDAGPLYIYFAVYFWLVFIYAAGILLSVYLKSQDIKRKQLFYVMISSIGFLGGGSVFFLTFNISMPPWLLSLFAVYPILITYAISRHGLFNTKVVATEFFIFTIWIVLLIKFLLSINQGPNEWVFNLIILVGVVFFGIFLARSVIQEVRQKEHIQELAMKLEKAYEVEKKANDDLKELDKTKNQFLIQVQHDLRSPLAVVRGYCDLIIDGTVGKQPKKTIEIMHKIQTVAEEKLRDVNNFLDVTQFRLGKGVANLSPGLNLNEILRDIFKLLIFKAEQKKIFLNLDEQEQEILITADKEKIKSALLNVIDNAIKYTKEGGVIVRVEKMQSLARVTIKDTGIGIPQEKINTIFEDQFVRTKEAQKIAEGKGVGLYLSGQIIKLHKGAIRAVSLGEGKGSEFIIDLPI